MLAFLRDEHDFPNRIMPKQLVQWIRVLDATGRELLSRPDDSFVASAFWVRLYGLLAEGLEWLRDDRAELETGTNSALVRLADSLIAAIEAVKAPLNDDELVYLQYRRHVESHPFQDRSYRITQRASGALRDMVFGTLIGRNVAITDVNAIVKSIETATGDTTGGVAAVQFARRLLPAISRSGTPAIGYEIARVS